MAILYAGVEACRALIIDGNHTSRSILAGQLRDLGVGTISQSTRPQDARIKLEQVAFDFVLCDYHFENTDYSGQDLLDDLRRAQLLPYFTTFVMVTGEASYNKVAEAAESALDGYLIKPYSASALGERLLLSRNRKIALKQVFSAIEAGEIEQAAGMCVQRFLAGESFGLYAARIGGELLMRQGMVQQAKALYQKVLEREFPPAWARLGLARTLFESQQASQARKVLESLVRDQPDFAEGHDMLGRLQVEQGELSDALSTYKRAWDITPSSITRSVKLGAISYYMGREEDAVKPLERAAALGGGSKMFDHQSLILLALLRCDAKDHKATRRCLSSLQSALDKNPDNPRLARQFDVVRILTAVAERQAGELDKSLNELDKHIDGWDLDVEGACNILSALARLPEDRARSTRAVGWVEQLAWRFSGNKAAAQLMQSSSEKLPAQLDQIVEVLTQAQATVQTALTHALAGEKRHTVTELYQLAQKWRNAKWADMAGQALERHRAHIDDADVLSRKIEELKHSFFGTPGKLPLGQDNGGRQTGSMSLRVQQTAEAGPATPMAPPAPTAAPEVKTRVFAFGSA